MSKWSLPKRAGAQKVAFVDARIVDPETGLDIKGDLVVLNGKIADFAENLLSDTDLQDFDDVIECSGNLLMPGVIDIHVHFRDPGQTESEDIVSGTKAAAAGGVTTVVCQPNTKPRIDNIQTLKYVIDKSAAEGFINVLCYAGITGTKDVLSDMEQLCAVGAVGFTDDGLPVMNSMLMREAFKQAAALGVPVAQHAEDLHLSNGGCINEGMMSHKLHVPGITDLAESVMVARDIMLMDGVDSHYHVLHISTVKAIDAVIKPRREGRKVTCEVTPHHFLLTEEALGDYDTMAKMNPPLRTEEDRKYMLWALKEGIIDAIASDHAPHNEVYKNLPLTKAAFGIVGLETILPLSLELYHSGFMDLHSVLAKLTCNPAKIIGSPAGRIKIGAPADLTLLDLDQEFIIDPKKFASKSRNTPFVGRKVKGKVISTIVGGSVVYSEQ